MPLPPAQEDHDQDLVNAMVQASEDWAELVRRYPGFRRFETEDDKRFAEAAFASAIGRMRLSLDNLAEVSKFRRGFA